jgi:hypothetical protein
MVVGRQFDPRFADLLLRVIGEQRAVWQARMESALKLAAAQARAGTEVPERD